MGKLERKFGKYAIKNLSLILIICYAVGYLISEFPSMSSIFSYLTLNPYAILHGQIWRLVTWIIVPPQDFTLATLITLFFYYSIGVSLERAWGDWLYNVYIFSGMLFTVVGSFIIYVVYCFILKDPQNVAFVMSISATFFSTYYVNMSIFLAFAATFPEARVLLMFLIPIKVKWLGFLYGGLLVYEFIYSNGWISRIVIFVSLLNFIVFYLVQKSNRFGSPKMRVQQAVRRREFNRDVKRETAGQRTSVTKHKCAICGKTEVDSPDMEFRFCSKCNGNYEYCSNHLFTHKHIE